MTHVLCVDYRGTLLYSLSNKMHALLSMLQYKFNIYNTFFLFNISNKKQNLVILIF